MANEQSNFIKVFYGDQIVYLAKAPYDYTVVDGVITIHNAPYEESDGVITIS